MNTGKLAALLAMLGAFALAGCSKPEKVSLDDPGSLTVSKDWSDSDIRTAAGVLAADLAVHPAIAKAKGTPVILPGRIENKTLKHLNTNIIISRIETSLLKTGKVAFVDGEARKKLAKEYEYMTSGNVDPKTQKGPGKQAGCDFILWGSIENVVARQGKDKVDYYYIKLKLTDVKTGLVRWKGEQETKKRIRK